MFKAGITYDSCEETDKVQVETPEWKNLLGRLESISDENTKNNLKYVYILKGS
jgi:hypothetical protein